MISAPIMAPTTPPLFHQNRGVAGRRLREARSRQSRDKQQDSDVVDQQAEEERTEKAQGVAPELRRKQIAHGSLRFRRRLIAGLDERCMVWNIVSDLSKDLDQFRPSFFPAGEESGRFRQGPEEKHRQHDRYDSTEYKESPPAVDGKNSRGQKRGERAA